VRNIFIGVLFLFQGIVCLILVFRTRLLFLFIFNLFYLLRDVDFLSFNRNILSLNVKVSIVFFQLLVPSLAEVEPLII
jgi:hypothetical protein